MNLSKVKENIKIVSSDEAMNERILGLLRQPDDCFGLGYIETNKQCEECNILSELGDKRAELKEFCKDSTTSQQEKKVGEISKEEINKEILKKDGKKKSYISIVRNNLKKSNDDILKILINEFPNEKESKLKGRLKATIKYCSEKEVLK
jgi:hypothetical protein